MTPDNFQGLETLEAWKRAKDFAVKVCLLILPKVTEDFIFKRPFGFVILRAVHFLKPTPISRLHMSQAISHKRFTLIYESK